MIIITLENPIHEGLRTERMMAADVAKPTEIAKGLAPKAYGGF